jgi:predicted nucleic acid-binding protein
VCSVARIRSRAVLRAHHFPCHHPRVRKHEQKGLPGERRKTPSVYKFLARTGKIVVPQTIPDVIKEDRPDNHILACALAGDANLIVSQDLDLLRRKFETIGIMSPIDFLNTLEGFKKAA